MLRMSWSDYLWKNFETKWYVVQNTIWGRHKPLHFSEFTAKDTCFDWQHTLMLSTQDDATLRYWGIHNSSEKEGKSLFVSHKPKSLGDSKNNPGFYWGYSEWTLYEMAVFWLILCLRDSDKHVKHDGDHFDQPFTLLQPGNLSRREFTFKVTGMVIAFLAVDVGLIMAYMCSRRSWKACRRLQKSRSLDTGLSMDIIYTDPFVPAMSCTNSVKWLGSSIPSMRSETGWIWNYGNPTGRSSDCHNHDCIYYYANYLSVTLLYHL
jgi:hypothetical protein